LTAIPGVREIVSGDKVSTEIRMPSDHMAVLVRLQNAQAGQLVYSAADEKDMKLEINHDNWGVQEQAKDADALCLKLKGGTYLTAKPLYPVDKAGEYIFSMDAKAVGDKQPTLLFGVMCFDKDKQEIPTIAVNTVDGTETTLAAEAPKGTQEVVISNGRNWKAGNFIAFTIDDSGNFKDLPNRDVSAKINKVSDNAGRCVLTLDKPLGKSYPAGTKIRMHKSGNSYLYLVSVKPGSEWKTYSATVKGILSNGFTAGSFKPGTKFFRVLCFTIGGQGKDCFSLIKNVQIKEKHSGTIKKQIER
jgi:hypothetical protein